MLEAADRELTGAAAGAGHGSPLRMLLPENSMDLQKPGGLHALATGAESDKTEHMRVVGVTESRRKDSNRSNGEVPLLILASPISGT